jgi:hypothetical protein
MRHSQTPQYAIDMHRIIHLIEEGIQVEKLHLEAHKILGDDIKYLSSEKSITQGEIYLSLLRSQRTGS